MKKRKGAMYSEVQAKSVTEVERALLDMAFTDKEAYSVVKQISEPIVGQLKVNAPVNEGKVQRSIRIFRSKKDPYRRVQIGPQYIKGGGPDAGNAAHLTEFGTDERVMKEGLRYGVVRGTLEKFGGPRRFAPYAGKRTGRVQSLEWIYKTYTQTKPQAEATAEQAILDITTKKAKKNGLA